MKNKLLKAIPILLMGVVLAGCATEQNNGGDGDKTKFNVTFDYNYEGAPANVVKEVEEGAKVDKITDPTRESYVFDGWFINETTFTTENKFDFETTISKDTTLYAGWTSLNANKDFVIEAEYCPVIDDITGNGFSGTATGSAMILNDTDDKYLEASNGKFVSFLYKPNLQLDYIINSDVAVSGAVFKFRISCEFYDVNVNSTDYTINVNGSPLAYEAISLKKDSKSPYSGQMGKFKDYSLDYFDLVAGQNTISFITTNTKIMGGTMTATAPVFDAFKITAKASANLTLVTDPNEY